MNQTPVILPKRKELGFLNPKSLNNMNKNKFDNKEQNKQIPNVQTIKVKSLKIKLEFNDNSIPTPGLGKNDKSDEKNNAKAIKPNDSMIISLKKRISQRQAYNNLDGYNVKNLKQKHYVVNVREPYEPTRAEINKHEEIHSQKNDQVDREWKMHSKTNKLIDGCYVCKYATKREIIRLPEIINRNKLRSQNTKTPTTTHKSTEDRANKGSSMWSLNIEESQLDYHKPAINNYSGSRNNSLMTTMNFLNEYESRLSHFRRQQNNLVRNQLRI